MTVPLEGVTKARAATIRATSAGTRRMLRRNCDAAVYPSL
jgi:hypothetical protein